MQNKPAKPVRKREQSPWGLLILGLGVFAISLTVTVIDEMQAQNSGAQTYQAYYWGMFIGVVFLVWGMIALIVRRTKKGYWRMPKPPVAPKPPA
jgi:uncharacterized PurR-regulated membrane protein YhhQ (DUF165 family)